MQTNSKPEIFRIASKIAFALGSGTLAPKNAYCGVSWNLETYILQVLEENYGITMLERHRFIGELEVQLKPTIQNWIENTLFCPKFPVPHPELTNERAYFDVDNKWSDDKYGDAHRRLCLHIANELARSTPTKRFFKWITS